MAKYHTIKINGMDYRQYAYDAITNRGMSVEKLAEDFEFKFGMPESIAASTAKGIAWNKSILSEIGSEINAQRGAEQRAATPWQQHPATEKQLAYLAKLNVNVTRQLTKGQASAIIDSVKSGNGVGTFGLTFYDGSN